MPRLSVLTAVYGVPAYFHELADSVLSQDLPDGWDLEWLIQEDGPATDQVTALAARDERCRTGANGVHRGTAATRNAALARAGGEYVRTVDQDDLLLPGSLADGVNVLRRRPSVHWVAAQADDLTAQGRRPHPSSLPAGVIAPGTLGDHLLAHATVPVHGAGLTVRTVTLRALGGWAGVPRSDDVSVLIALSELTEGYLSPEVTWLYRRHPGQTINAGWWQDLAETSRQHVTQRLLALRALGLAIP